MKHLLLTLLLVTLCAATVYGQTIRTLGFNTTNGQVVANTGTNVLTFTNTNGIEGVKFNKIGIENGIFLYDQATVSFDGEAYFNTISFQTTNDASGTRANLGFSTNLNTFWTATNSSNARSAVGLVATWLTNTNGGVSFMDQLFGGTNEFDNYIGTLRAATARRLRDKTELVEDEFYFDSGSTGTEWEVPFPTSFRKALGIPLAALTNTSNVTMMRALAGSTNTNTPASGTYQLTNIISLTISNGIIVDVEEP